MSRFPVTRRDQLEFLHHCELQKYLNVIFWNKPHKINTEGVFILDNAEVPLFLERAQQFNLKPVADTNNVQLKFDKQTIGKYLGYVRSESYDFNSFYSLDDIYKWLKDLALKHSKEVTLDTIGISNEGRYIQAVLIKKVEGNKKLVIVEGGAHATEWISIVFVTYLIHQLLEGENNMDPKFATIANKYHWYLIPVLNPDGYEYNMKTDRMWKKNRRQIQGKYYGVDLNRNFAYSFGTYDTSKDPKDESYCGPGPFSEPETRALADLVVRNNNDLKFFFSIHTFGQMIAIPFSDNLKHLGNYNEMENYAKQAALKVYRTTGRKYLIGTHFAVKGTRASGDSASWVKKYYKTRYVLTMYLRDNGTYGYAIPSYEILPACREAQIAMTEIMTTHPKFISTTMFNKTNAFKNSHIVVMFCLFVLWK